MESLNRFISTNYRVAFANPSIKKGDKLGDIIKRSRVILLCDEHGNSTYQKMHASILEKIPFQKGDQLFVEGNFDEKCFWRQENSSVKHVGLEHLQNVKSWDLKDLSIFNFDKCYELEKTMVAFALQFNELDKLYERKEITTRLTPEIQTKAANWLDKYFVFEKEFGKNVNSTFVPRNSSLVGKVSTFLNKGPKKAFVIAGAEHLLLGNPHSSKAVESLRKLSFPYVILDLKGKSISWVKQNDSWFGRWPELKKQLTEEKEDRIQYLLCMLDVLGECLEAKDTMTLHNALNDVAFVMTQIVSFNKLSPEQKKYRVPID